MTQRGNRDKFGKVIGTNLCEMIITGTYAKAGEPTLNVRCYCMAVYRGNKWGNFKYDRLGKASSITEAVALWETHVKEKARANLTSITLDDTLVTIDEEEPNEDSH